MNEKLSFNDWTVTGVVSYIKELQGEFACSLRIKGQAQRDGCYSSQILDFPCLMQKKIYEDAKKKGMDYNKSITLSGHLESWQKGTSINPKIMFVADYVLEVA